MATTTTIYLDDEGSLALKKRRDEDPNFNFSSFINSKLIADDKDEQAKEDPEVIKIQIKDLQRQRELLADQIDHLEEKYRKSKKEVEESEEEKAEEEEREARIRERNLLAWQGSLKTFYHLDYAKAESLAKEYSDWRDERTPEEDNTIFLFMQKKGYDDPRGK